jgi:hypothetical protein
VCDQSDLLMFWVWLVVSQLQLSVLRLLSTFTFYPLVKSTTFTLIE